MKIKDKAMNSKWAAYTIATCSAVVLYLALSHLSVFLNFLKYIWSVFSPVIIGVVIAYILNPLVKVFYHKVFKKVKSNRARNNLSIMATILCVIAIIAILLVAMIPQIADSVTTFIDNLELYSTSFLDTVGHLGITLPAISSYVESFSTFSENILKNVTNLLTTHSSTIIDTSYSIGVGMFNGLVGFILAIYFLADKVRIKEGIRKLMHLILSDKRYDEYSAFWLRCNDILIKYIVFDILDGIVIGLVNALLMLIFGIPYVALISVIVGVFNLLPTFGPILGGAIGAFLLVLVNPWYALTFLIITVVIQTFDGYILKPKLFSGSLGVPGVWILITIIIGGKLFGVAGILLSIPFAAIFVIVYDEYILVKLQQQKDRRSKKIETKLQDDDKL
ncbi:MAG: AI-2E family transporter [Butyrivibrio sp.]|nr:AI-2E family transporter [Butyrivibrio sp.]